MFRALPYVSIAALLVATVLFTAGATSSGSAASQKLAAEKTADLKDRLEKGLKARRPVEFEFIDKVVAHVESGELPVDLVDRTFFWARKREPVRPFQHFERALKILAKRIGVDL
ncbi:MAG: hypothetical protein WDZ59_00080 [Pirellulales bacterium]